MSFLRQFTIVRYLFEALYPVQTAVREDFQIIDNKRTHNESRKRGDYIQTKHNVNIASDKAQNVAGNTKAYRL